MVEICLNVKNCHNPYFSRWFSAIVEVRSCEARRKLVTILILVDGFLQLCYEILNYYIEESQSLF